jgi:tetratricopeptide (TPR) repeat protein
MTKEEGSQGESEFMPGNREIFAAAMSQADSLRWDSQWTEAARQYQRALAEFPNDTGARSGLGFCYLQTRQWKAALAEYQRVLEQDATSVIALSKVAELYVTLQRRMDAFRAYLALGDYYAGDGQPARAEAAWQKAAQQAPEELEPHERLASHFRSKKDRTAALREQLVIARIYQKRGDLAKVREYAEAVLRSDPGNAEAQGLLENLKKALSGAPSGGKGLREEAATYVVASSPETSDEGALFWTGPLARLQASSSMKAVSVPPADTPGMASQAAQEGVAGAEALNADITGRTGNSMAKKGTPPAGGAPKGAGNAGRGGSGEQGGRKRMSAAQVASALRQAQAAQAEGHIAEAIDLCEQIISSGFERPDARYFLGWLYQEQERYEEAIQQFSVLLDDPDYALSCFYALGQCYRAMGDLGAAAQHFDEAVDRVNLDALTLEESDQLIQLCHEAAEAHRALGELDQTETVYSALLGFLRSRGWQDQIAEVEQMMAEGGMQEGFPPEDPAEEPPTVTFNQRGSSPDHQRIAESATVLFDQPNESPNALFDGSFGSGPAAPLPPARGQSRPGLDNDDWLSSPAPAAPQPAAPSSPIPGSYGVNGQSGSYAAGGSSDPLAALASGSYAPMPTGSSVVGTPADPLKALLGAAGGSSGLSAPTGAVSPVLANMPPLPEPLRSQVMTSVRDIEKYVSHGLLTAAIEECLRVIEMAPQYLDIHLLLGEIYVRQGKTEQAITKYAILIDTYLVNGRVDDAIGTYRRILQLDPDNLTYRVRLINLLASHGRSEELLRERTTAAETYLRLGYTDKAIQEYEQALQENPNQIPMRLNYALSLMKAGRAAQAINEYQRILQLDPRNATALSRWQIAIATGLNTSPGASGMPGSMGAGANRAASLEVLSRLLKALRGDGQRYFEVVAREYAQAVEASPSNVDLRYSFGQIQQQAGRFAEALVSYKEALSGPGMEVLCRYAIAKCFLDQGGISNATGAVNELEEAARAARLTPIDPTVWNARPRDDHEEHHAPDVEISLLLAKAYQQAGQGERAQTILQQIKQMLPAQGAVYPSTHASAPPGYGSAQQSAPMYASVSQPMPAFGSAAQPKQSMELPVPANLQEFAQLVKHYRANKQIEMAVDILKKMCAMAPSEPMPHAELGDIYINWGMLDEGLSELRTQVELHLRIGQTNEAAKALQRIASIYWDMGNHTESLGAFRQVIQLVPEDMQARMEMVQYALQAGRRDEAAQHQSVIARHYFASRQTKEAVAALQQLIAMDKRNFEAYDLLGQTYSDVGEYEQAQRVYRNLAKVDPDNQVAYQRMQQLQELRMRQV